MSDTQVRPTERVDAWHLKDAGDVVRALESDPDRDLSMSAAASRLGQPALLTIGAVVLVVLSTEIGFLQRLLLTTELTGPQWLACLGLAAAFAAAVEIEKAWRRDPSIPRAPEETR